MEEFLYRLLCLQASFAHPVYLCCTQCRKHMRAAGSREFDNEGKETPEGRFYNEHNEHRIWIQPYRGLVNPNSLKPAEITEGVEVAESVVA